jgi:drug/metabolite transporter (DMT)-like permease
MDRVHQQLSDLTLGLILVAAVAHASWNALSKLIPDRLVAASLIGILYTLAGACALPFLPVPHAAAWPFIIASALTQSAYLLLLMGAYRAGEFGAVYPITRGMSPLLVSIVAVGFLGEQMSAQQLGGIVLVCVGLAALVFVRGIPRSGSGYGLAMLTGVTIAAYTLIDGLGVRHSGSALGYAAWLFALQGPMVPIIATALRGRRLARDLAPHWRIGIVGGLLSVLSYGIIVWAQSRAPLAAVATLRETSVVLAAFLGRLMFKERLGPIRVAAAVAVAGGIVAIAT